MRTGSGLAREAKRFDFDERKLGNYESLPMNWLPVTGSAYPRFVEPAFDMDTGHNAPPSFQLRIRTGNVGSYYFAKDIPAHPGSEYRVSGWVRTQGLEHASAYITAYYLDHAMEPIEGTEQHSQPVNRNSSSREWTHVVVDLPGGVKNARWIALSCRIEQPIPDDPREGPFAPIPQRDTNAAAWFDDIAVIRRPRVMMELDRPSHCYDKDETIQCRIKLLDLDGAGLDVSLQIDDALDRTLQRFVLDGPTLLKHPQPIDITPLQPGLYTARLQMRLDKYVIAEHERRFVVLNRQLAGARETGEGFGISLSDESVDRPEIADLIRRLNPGAVKLPLWRFGLTDEEVVYGDNHTRNLIETFRNAGIDIVAVLDALPKQLASEYTYTQRTVDRAMAIPRKENSNWVPWLGLLLMRHGAWTNTWQLGDDTDSPRLDASTLQAALGQMREVVDPLVGKPRIVVPTSSFGGATAKLDPSDITSTTFGFHQTPDVGEDITQSSRMEGHGADWASISIAPESRYDRHSRLMRFARGLISARALGYEAVFAPALWEYQPGDEGDVIRPREELAIFHTVVRRLGDLPNATRLTLHPELESWLFTDAANQRGAIALWWPDEREASITLDLSASASIHDVWGNPLATSSSERGVTIHAGGMPILIGPVSARRIQSIDSFDLKNATMTASIRTQPRELTLLNTYSDDLVGELLLQGPAGWRVSPRRIPVKLRPGETLTHRVDLKPPSNAPAGWYTLAGRLDAGGDGEGSTYMYTPVRVDAPGLDVNVFAHRDGDSIRFVQRITNTDDRVMNLRAYLIAPDRPRDLRTISHLGAGETATREFRVEPAADLAGGFVRISVEEVDGQLKHNTIIEFNEPLAE